MERSGKMLVTKMPAGGGGCRLCAWVEEGRVAEILLPPLEQTGVFGNIYVGQVERVLPNIHGAFVRIGKEQICFYDLKEQGQAVYIDGKQPVGGQYLLRAGDRMLVQVSRQQMRGKRPTVTSRLTVTGRYLVLSVPGPYLRLSKKLSGGDRARLKAFMESLMEPEVSGGYGITVRTNARHAARQEIIWELGVLKKRLQKILERGRSQQAGTLVEEALPFYLAAIRDARTEGLEEIVADEPGIYGEIAAYLRDQQPQDLPKLRLYEDPSLSLYELYSLGHVLAGIQRPRVWLKSGGTLVIEQTEAFVSIDVNTGGYVSKKDAQETYRRVNLEAAEEIARQLRLRDLSGVILVDFIDMKKEEHQKELMSVFQGYLKKDPVKAEVIDMTALKIVEVTRQKVRRPVAEELEILNKRERKKV